MICSLHSNYSNISLLEYYQTGRYGDAEKLSMSLTHEFPFDAVNLGNMTGTDSVGAVG
jgi:hypothetical protein